MVGNHLSEEQFSVALPSVLSLHFMEASAAAYQPGVLGQLPEDISKSYLSVHWSGDSDLDDARLWVQTCVNRGGLKATGDIMIQNAFELVRFNAREVVFFGTRKSDISVQAKLKGTPESVVKWDVVRYHLDPRAEREVQSFVVYREIQEDILGLKFQADDEDLYGMKHHHKRTKPIPPTLTVTTSNSFILIFNALEEGGIPAPLSRSDSLASNTDVVVGLSVVRKWRYVVSSASTCNMHSLICASSALHRKRQGQRRQHRPSSNKTGGTSTPECHHSIQTCDDLVLATKM